MTILRLLRDPRITLVAALIVLQFFAAEWVVSATWRGHYSYRVDQLGPLGLEFCGPQGRWPCSALYPVMNVSLVLTGLAISTVAASWALRRIVTFPHAGALLIAGFGLAVSGIITEKTDYQHHSAELTTFFVLASVGVAMIGFSGSTLLTPGIRAIVALAGIIATVAFISYATGLTGWFGSGGTQRLIVYPILVAVVVAGVSSGRVRTPGDRSDDTSDLGQIEPAPVTSG
ncbi:hypothetical protein [Gordonia aichiensis]